jgi:hypothetical protein
MGVFRAHASPSWAAACLMVGGIAFDVAMVANSAGIAIAATAAVIAGVSSTGLMVWRETDEAWDHTPALGAR